MQPHAERRLSTDVQALTQGGRRGPHCGQGRRRCPASGRQQGRQGREPRHCVCCLLSAPVLLGGWGQGSACQGEVRAAASEGPRDPAASPTSTSSRRRPPGCVGCWQWDFWIQFKYHLITWADGNAGDWRKSNQDPQRQWEQAVGNCSPEGQSPSARGQLLLHQPAPSEQEGGQKRRREKGAPRVLGSRCCGVSQAFTLRSSAHPAHPGMGSSGVRESQAAPRQPILCTSVLCRCQWDRTVTQRIGYQLETVGMGPG